MKKDKKDYINLHTDLVKQRQAISLKIKDVEDALIKEYSDIQVGDLVNYKLSKLPTSKGKLGKVKYVIVDILLATEVRFRYKVINVKKDLTEGEYFLNDGFPVDMDCLEKVAVKVK